MTSDAGWYRLQTKAIGTITPSGNIVVERVTAAILADFPEVSGHFSRIPVFGSSVIVNASAPAALPTWPSIVLPFNTSTSDSPVCASSRPDAVPLPPVMLSA